MRPKQVLYNNSKYEIFIGCFFEDELGKPERMDFLIGPGKGFETNMLGLELENTLAEEAIDIAWEENG